MSQAQTDLSITASALAADIVASCRALFGPTGIKADIATPLLITSACGRKCIMQCIWVLKTPIFVPECIFYRLCDNEVWSDVPLELPCTFALCADSVVALSDWAIHFALLASAPLTYQRIGVDWASSDRDSIFFTDLREVQNINSVRERNRTQAAAMRAMRLLNAALTPWFVKPKRRRAVVKRQYKCEDDGGRIAEEPGPEEEIVLQHATDDSGAETDHGT